MKCLKIGIIDEGIDFKTVEEVVPKFRGRIKLHLCKSVNNYIDNTFPVNHGTLCTLLLIEKLIEFNIDDKIEIIYLPITNNLGEKDVKCFIKALNFFVNNQVDIISMSIGIQTLLYAKELLRPINKLKNTVLLAAAANDFRITYPASFSQVIGVQRSILNKNDIMYIDEPIDGIDVIFPPQYSRIITMLYNKYKLDYSKSNSILVPQLAAILANELMRCYCTENSNYVVLNYLSNYRSKIEINDMIKKYGSDEKMPLVLVSYSKSNYKYILNNLQDLKNIFESQMYTCSIVHDFSKTCFEDGWYYVDLKNINLYIEFYEVFLTDGIIILLIEEKNIKSINIDYYRCLGLENRISRETLKLIFEDIMNYFS